MDMMRFMRAVKVDDGAPARADAIATKDRASD